MAGASLGPHPVTPLGTDPDWARTILDSSAAAVIGIDLDGRTIFWSSGAQRLFGWTPQQVLGHPPPHIPPRLTGEWQVQIQRRLVGGVIEPAAETQRLARDGRLLTVVHTSSPLLDAEGRITGLLDTLTDITALKGLEEESLGLALARERELIAMDLHDGVVQSLYALLLILESRLPGLGQPAAEQRALLEEALRQVKRVLTESREYLFELSAREFAAHNLTAGLQLISDGLRLVGGVRVDFDVDPSAEQAIEPALRGHVLYLAREAMSNVLRHASASTTRVDLRLIDQRVILTIADDGRGFNPARASRSAGRHGLRTMAERARLVGARLSIHSTRRGGTTVRVELPVS